MLSSAGNATGSVVAIITEAKRRRKRVEATDWIRINAAERRAGALCGRVQNGGKVPKVGPSWLTLEKVYTVGTRVRRWLLNAAEGPGGPPVHDHRCATTVRQLLIGLMETRCHGFFGRRRTACSDASGELAPLIDILDVRSLLWDSLGRERKGQHGRLIDWGCFVAAATSEPSKEEPAPTRQRGVTKKTRATAIIPIFLSVALT